MQLNISSSDLKLVKNILSKHLTKGDLVYAYGSRTKNTCSRYSDLDLAVRFNNRNKEKIIDLKNDFEFSDLPWKVDIHDIGSFSKEFQISIETDLQLIASF